MKLRSLMTVVVLGAFVVLVGCRTAGVLNIEDAPINASAKPIDVKKSILRAGAALGWQMKDAGDGHIIGTLILRSHVAKVDITYDTKKYSIRYKDSTNLNYDGTNIHSNYNGWIQNLDRNIKAQLTIL